MTKPSIGLQDLRRRIYRKAKSDKAHRFWGIFVHITKAETLHEAYRIAKRNGGAHGIDGVTFNDVESMGRGQFIEGIRQDLIAGVYSPQKNRRVDIPKDNGKVRTLQIPSIRDRVVQGALKLILEAIRCQTAQEAYEAVNYHRFSDDIVITVSGHHSKSGWAARAMERLQEELAPLGVCINRDKTRIVSGV